MRMIAIRNQGQYRKGPNSNNDYYGDLDVKSPQIHARDINFYVYISILVKRKNDFVTYPRIRVSSLPQGLRLNLNTR